MKNNLTRTFRYVILVGLFLFGFVQTTFAVNIVPANKLSQFLTLDIDGDLTMDRINWYPTAAGVTVSDSNLTGYAWGETAGWINTDPALSGVDNDCSGNLSGYAWGEKTGWINFAPTLGGVTIDTTTGNFDGYAWSQNFGWIEFTCPGADTCVQTTWNGCGTVAPGTTSGSLLDLCLNIAGNQTTVPGGYYKDTPGSVPGNCYLNTTITDLCLNIAGNQTTVPGGYYKDTFGMNPGNCYTLPPVPPADVCPGIPGIQTSILDCPPSVGDVCPGIPGIQTSILDCPPVINNPVTNPGATPSTVTTPTNSGVTTSPLDTPSLFDTSDKTFAQKHFPWIFSLLGLLATIPGLLPRIGQLLLSIFVYGRKKPWGIVYDSKTKEPLDPAYVNIFDATTHESVAEAFTDIEGRYGFLLKPGNYYMTATKTDYAFPSDYLRARQSDPVYDHLYFGESFTVVDEKHPVIFNIPMDPVKENWNQLEKRRAYHYNFFRPNAKRWNMVFDILYILGFAYTIFVTWHYPVIWNVVMLALYVTVLVLRIFGYGPVSLGVLKKNGVALAHGIVEIINPKTQTLITKKIATEQGTYFALVQKGTYDVRVSENIEEKLTMLAEKKNISGNRGVIDTDFNIRNW